MNTDIKTHTFENGDLLTLVAVDSYYGYHGLTVYTVSYYEKDTDSDTGETIYNSMNGDNYMSLTSATTGFETRLASEKPFDMQLQNGGTIANLVLDAFANYLGEGTLQHSKTPDDWDGFAKHVLNMAFTQDGRYYDGAKIHQTLTGLETTSSKSSAGRADTMLAIPAWKLLEMMTAVTAFAMMIKQQQPVSMLKAA